MSKKIRKSLICLCLALLSLFSICFTFTVGVCYASVDISGGKYSNVLDDLKTDSNFVESDYEVVANDYSLKLIQIAESNDKELFVYVYRPSGDFENLIATSINISTSYHTKKDFRNYKLILLNSNGVFSKYIVDKFTVGSDNVRSYEIASIFRKWDKKYDKDIKDENGNTISEVSFAVGKQYTMTGTGKNTSVACSDIDYITITSKYCGFVRYSGAGNFWQQLGSIFTGTNNCDSHFVAFSTDRQIDTLLEADVYFMSKTWHHNGTYGNDTYGTPTEKYSYLNNEQEFTYASGKWSYTRGRIQTTEEFIDSEYNKQTYNGVLFNVDQQNEMTDEGLQNIRSQQWVLRFYETLYSAKASTSGDLTTDSTIVYDVSIMRLKFETSGVVYDLPVIDNKQTGDGIQDNIQTYKYEMTDLFKIILALIGLVLLVIVLWPVLPIIISVIGKIFKWLFKAIIWVVTLPFKLFKKLFNKKE